MKIFGVGLNKTGTTSLGRALEILGFKGHASADLGLTKMWKDGNLSQIFEVAEQNEIFEDWPWPLLYRELEAKFPEAKFILTIRKSPEIWYDSLCKHSLKTGPTDFRKLIYGSYMPQGLKNEHISFYNGHIREVTSYFQERRKNDFVKLCFEDGDGWDVLCPFLGIKKPNSTFPKLNVSSLNQV